MTDSSNDTGVIMALMERFENQRLPQALAIKKRVDQGEALSEADIAFLNQVFKDSQHITPLIHKHPEWQSLFSRVTSLYKEIMDTALANEQDKNTGNRHKCHKASDQIDAEENIPENLQINHRLGSLGLNDQENDQEDQPDSK